MDRNTLFNILLNNFGFTPTEGQAKVLYHLSAFILSEKERPVYLLRGYAGTGKTTLVSTLVKTLPSIGMRYQLLAPTGRAAKVMTNYTGKTASTLHRKLYRFQVNANGEFRMAQAENKAKDTVFIVDECSMISDQGDGYSWSRSLLDDLIEYVFSGSCCKLLLIGDSAQLPPVGLDISPAMDFNILKNSFSLTLASYEMKEVMRQNLDSGILNNATKIRNLMSDNSQQLINYSQYELPLLNINDFHDIEKIDPMSFEELLWNNFGDKRNNNEAVVICRSNKRANMFNQAIRSRVLQEEGELSTGDKLMVVKNNYYWSKEETTRLQDYKTTSNNPSSASVSASVSKIPSLSPTPSSASKIPSLSPTPTPSPVSFIANGDMVEIKRINKFEEMYGFHFADVDIQLTDYEDAPTLSVKIIMEALYSDSPALSNEEAKRLYHAVEEDYMDIPRAADRRKAMKENPYYNALQVKFGYALTCHKTQGGQWNNVFVEAPYLPNETTLEHSDLRWLYTAITRAKEKIYLVNFKDEWFTR